MPTDKVPIQRRITEAARSAWRATKKWAPGTNAAQAEDRRVETALEINNEIDRFVKWFKAHIKRRPKIGGTTKERALQREDFMQTNSNKDSNGAGPQDRAIEQKNEQQEDIVEEAARAVWKTIKHPVILALIVLTASVIVTHNYTFIWKSQTFKDAHADAIDRGKSERYAELYAQKIDDERSEVFADAYAQARVDNKSHDFAEGFAMGMNRGYEKDYAEAFGEGWEAIGKKPEEEGGALLYASKYPNHYADARMAGENQKYAEAYASAKYIGYSERFAKAYGEAKGRGDGLSAHGYAIAIDRGRTKEYAEAFGRVWWFEKDDTFADNFARAYLVMKKERGASYAYYFSIAYAVGKQHGKTEIEAIRSGQAEADRKTNRKR